MNTATHNRATVGHRAADAHFACWLCMLCSPKRTSFGSCAFVPERTFSPGLRSSVQQQSAAHPFLRRQTRYLLPSANRVYISSVGQRQWGFASARMGSNHWPLIRKRAA